MVREINRDIESAGKRLMAIKDSDLWRELEYATWESFVEGEFPFTRRRANQLVVHERLMSAIGAGTSVPTFTEAQTRNVSEEARERVTKSAAVDPEAGRNQLQREVSRVRPALPVKVTSRTKDSATGAPCEHPRTLTVVVCADCGKRVE